MSIERKFISESIEKTRLSEFLAKSLSNAGYGGSEINRTPLGTQIITYVEKPGLVIGKGGENIRSITEEVKRRFKFDNPQIEVLEAKKTRLNPLIMANKLANLLERGWYFRRAGHSILNEIMGEGALGCEIKISGKLTGPRARTEKFIKGYIIHSGEPVYDIVETGFAIAKKKLGVIGVSVRILPPDAKLPDKYNILDIVETETVEEEKTKGDAVGSDESE